MSCGDSTGTAQLSIAFDVPAGRGLAPDLTLTYGSGGGNGIFGVGFELSQSSIARKTNKTFPRYDRSDLFCLNGGPALVPLPETPRTRMVGGKDYAVTTHRARSLVQDMRIEQWVAADASENFWRTIDSENRITIYGRSADARIADPADPTRIYEWLIEWEADARGNAISYAYKVEDNQGVARSSGEINRVYGANRYLDRIRYTNQRPIDPAPIGIDDPAALIWLIEIVADHGEYDVSPANDHPYTAVRPWPARQDIFSNYSAGFERRTARLCRSLLLFHRFADDLGPDPVLVRALTFQYDENPTLTRLVGAIDTGFRFRPKGAAGQRYHSRSLPALTLDYTAYSPQTARFVPLGAADGSPLPGLDGPPGHALVDLYGHGAPGILYADGESTFYRAPRAANCTSSSALIYTAPRECPQFALERRINGDGLALVDLDGDGRLELEVVAAARAGSYKIAADGTWSAFRPFEGITTDYHAAEAEYFDLTGAGSPDVVLMRTDAVRYYPSRGTAGYGAPVEQPFTGSPSIAAPPIVSPLNAQSLVRFSDLCGAGGPQRVRISDGRATCWPSLGYGRFAPPVDLSRAPLFGGGFDARRLVLADLDGTGANDLIYAEAERLLVYRNQSGNGFAVEPLIVPLPARCTRPDQIRVADARGNGWDCLLFIDDAVQPQQWILDLCGGVKPYMLNRIRNGLGIETRIEYASSSRFQLEDREAGQPWTTSLAMPMPVVARVEEYEHVSGQCKVTDYRYRNGAMDGIEREFRGFGLIERREHEVLPPPAPGVTSPAATLVTRIWYHLGLAPNGEGAADQAFTGDPSAYDMPGSLFEWPDGFIPDAETQRQALVALAGNSLREEVYALDGSADEGVPFSVTQSRYRVRQLQPRGAHDAVFLVGDAETIRYDYERNAADPQVGHAYTLEVDDDGTVRRSVALNYPRRDGQLPQDPQQAELRTLCSVFTPVPRLEAEDALLFGLAGDEQSIAVSAMGDPDSKSYFSLSRMTALITAALATNPEPAAPHAELLGRTRHFWITDSTGTITPQALPLRSDEAVFTASAIAAAMAGVPIPGDLDSYLSDTAGFLREDGLWWKPGAQASYAPATHFHLVSSTRDAFAQRSSGPSGVVVSCTYDAYDLLVIGVETSGRDGDVLPHRLSCTYVDYQSLSAWQTTDSNGTVTEVIADPLDLVLATSKRGDEWNGTATAQVGFVPLPLDDPSSWPVPPSAAALLADPEQYLGGAEAIFFADFPDPIDPAAPSAEIAVHATSYPALAAPGTANGLVDVSVTWSDGRARIVQTSELAGSQTWRISGRDILLSNDQPWRQFHPIYAATPDFIAGPDLAKLKIAATHFYDPLDRPMRSAVPRADLWEAFFSTTTYDAWQVTEADLDDTVKDSAWYKRYVDPGDSSAPPLPPSERDALLQAARFHGTPSTTVLGSNAMPVQQIARPTQLPSDALVTHHHLDSAGRVDREADPRLGAAGLWNLSRSFSLTGEPIVVVTADRGTDRGLSNAVGNPLLSYDALGRLVQMQYDSFARVTAIALREGSAPTRIVERLVYGDSLDGSGQPLFAGSDGRNLIGQVVRHYDPAGFIEASAYALCSEPLTVSRAVLASYAADVDWSYTAPSGWTWSAQSAALAAALDSERFTVSRRYDALGRPTGGTDPAGNDTEIAFGPCGQIDRLSIAPVGATRFTYLDAVVYDADGKRSAESVLGPNGGVVDREFTYDPDNRRLTRITSRRHADGQAVQDVSYVYDPVGNVTHIDDDAAPAQGVISGGQIVTPARDFTYDALYRLTGATGRAHTALNKDNAASGAYDAFFSGGTLNDPNLLYRYTAGYAYDDSGNLTQIRFAAPPSQPTAGWTRTLSVDTASNRAVDTDTLGGSSIAAFFDAAGNQTRLGGMPSLAWDYRSRLRQVVLVDRGSAAQPDAQYLAYDGSGQKVRKTTQRLVAAGVLRVEDTLYFGGLEITRVRQDTTVVKECQRLRLMDENACVAERLTWTLGDPPAGVTGPQLRFPIDDRQGSSTLELDDQGKLVSYEEYAPYGVTVYASGPSLAEVSLKRYRFTCKERDRDTGLYDYGARHYAPWLGRWLSPDPAGPVDGLNLYAFVGGNPATWEDIGGLAKGKNVFQKKGGRGGGRAKAALVQKPKKTIIKLSQTGSKSSRRRQGRAVVGARQSGRLAKVREEKAAQFAAPTGTIGHYYRGTEHVDFGTRKKLFGSVTALRDDIRNKLDTDIKKFLLSSTALTGIPANISKFAADNWKRGDFLDAVTETVAHPTSGKTLTRPKYAAGKIVPRDGSGAKVGASVPHGGIDSSIDDKGHLVPEKGVSDTNSVRVNSADNVIPENWVLNQRYKTAFEQGAKEFAAANPTLHVMTIHLPTYASTKGPDASFRARPKEVVHLLAINGNIVSAFTFKNTKHAIEIR
ncbi:hypothetical protein SSBR45G_46930 [Bradyrhizobium sp. SSBR45G]|uniref:SpvB/TcaC N-terminal domain-containing protein n=1 Tax=Bradyrhizobium sp. SSBR45R TaxID=2996007 RepID=UPI00234298C3|nr:MULTISPECIES: SpvB/TcaC N-terminal domain-containing protein [unclassified Bradyrhizobium]GLH79784.1 hypothetical protein SSBR45G_46930 [Bradyrhizobium sp. SSBR45G]GLH87097.1 hypothetical protein SSBR45R_45570 [Bradyrhizobium sp. SSBR45R]